MGGADEFNELFEEDEDSLSIDDLLRDSPPGCLFCRLGEGGDD